jgi:uncharacterized protein with HEPN domain
MLPERDRVFMAQMVEAATAALDFTEGLSRETVCSDRLIGFAVVRAIQLVGQAARSVSDEVRAGNPDIPWRQMIGMRNVVVHDYADVDLSLVWKTVREDLPGPIDRLRAIMGDTGRP